MRKIRDEHKQAIDWLNEHTDKEINFFAVRMELWKINDSPPAPKFQIISKPNDWAKAMRVVSDESNLTQTKLMQLEFWNHFKEYVKEKGTSLKLRKASPQHWYDISIGLPDAQISLTLNTQSKTIACEIYISDSKDAYQKFFAKKDEIEQDLGEKLEWMELPEKKASRIKLSEAIDVNDNSKWEKCFGWFKNHAEKFQFVFLKYK